MKTRFIVKNEFSLIYEVEGIMILDKGTIFSIKAQDYIVENVNIVLGFKNDVIDIYISEVDYSKPILTKDTKLMDSGLSVRVLTCLRYYDIYPEEKISVLEGMREYNLMRMRNFGKKSAEELKNLCKKVKIEFLP